MPTTKIQSLLAYLAHKHESPSVTVLMKLSYLVDLISTQKNGNQISDFEYIRYHYGPYDPKIDHILTDLVLSGVFKVNTVFKGDKEVFEYEATGVADFSQLTDDEKSLIDEVMGTLCGYSAKTLTEIAYRTAPMKALGATLGGNENLCEKLDLKASV